MKKRAQFYIIAAVLIIALVVGLTTIVNKGTASPRANAFYDLSKNFETESVKVIDYGTYNKDEADVNINQKLSEFYLNYSAYALATEPTMTLSFIYGNATDATIGEFQQGSINTNFPEWGDQGVAMTNTRRIQTVYPVSGNPVTVKVGDAEYNFTLSSENGFYFVISAKKGDETLVSVKQK